MPTDVEQKYDIWLDAAAPKNRNVYFQPASTHLRGEARTSEVIGVTPAAFNAVGGVIPGQRLLVDSRNKIVTIIDRMTLPENAEIDRKLRKLATTEEYRDGAFTEYQKDVTFRPADEEWPTWLYYMRRLVDTGRLHVAKGTLPSMEKIRTMGPVVANPHQLAPKDSSKPYNVLPQLTPDGKLATASAN